MSEESSVALLQAYKDAIEANENSIAELLKTVILEVMADANQPAITIGGNKATIEPPWKVEAAPLSVPRSYTVNTTADLKDTVTL